MFHQINNLLLPETNHFGLISILFYSQYIGAPGRVEPSKGPGISVRFKGLKRSLYLNPVVFKKINNFSVNQLIRIRNDREVNRKIEKKFGKYKKGQEKV